MIKIKFIALFLGILLFDCCSKNENSNGTHSLKTEVRTNPDTLVLRIQDSVEVFTKELKQLKMVNSAYFGMNNITINKANFDKIFKFVERNGFYKKDDPWWLNYDLIFVDAQRNLYLVNAGKVDNYDMERALSHDVGKAIKHTEPEHHLKVYSFLDGKIDRKHFFSWTIDNDKLLQCYPDATNDKHYSGVIKSGYNQMLARFTKNEPHRHDFTILYGMGEYSFKGGMGLAHEYEFSKFDIKMVELQIESSDFYKIASLIEKSGVIAPVPYEMQYYYKSEYYYNDIFFRGINYGNKLVASTIKLDLKNVTTQKVDSEDYIKSPNASLLQIDVQNSPQFSKELFGYVIQPNRIVAFIGGDDDSLKVIQNVKLSYKELLGKANIK